MQVWSSRHRLSIKTQVLATTKAYSLISLCSPALVLGSLSGYTSIRIFIIIYSPYMHNSNEFMSDDCFHADCALSSVHSSRQSQFAFHCTQASVFLTQ